ncbi:hypothetical protein [Oculatella sp. LEGE 06141]
MIAILGWGSLIWKPQNLQYIGNWETGGPVLPLEFSRITKERPLTIILDPENGVACPTRVAQSAQSNLADAIRDLMQREGTTEERIGYVELQGNQSSLQMYPEQIKVDETIRRWCKDNQVSAAIWTAIPPNFSERLGIKFSVNSAIEYLKTLPESAQASGLEYFRKTPAEIQTPLRQRVAMEWSEAA